MVMSRPKDCLVRDIYLYSHDYSLASSKLRFVLRLAVFLPPERIACEGNTIGKRGFMWLEPLTQAQVTYTRRSRMVVASYDGMLM